MVEEIIAPPPSKGKSAGRGLGGLSSPQRLSDITGDAEERLPLSMGEFARVLGGGVVPGSVVLIGGDPGIGKSTLLLQVALEMAKSSRVLYVSGEESERQIKMRAIRLVRQAEREGDALEMPEELLLVVTDVALPLPPTVPQFGLEDVQGVAQLLAGLAATRRREMAPTPGTAAGMG